MKILIVVNHFPVLSEAFVARKVQELIHRNHEVIICASTYNDDLYRNFFGGDKKIKIILFSKINALGWLLLHPLSLINKTKTNAWHSYIASVINKIKPGIVHLEFSGLGAFYLPAVKKIHFPVMVSCHGTAEKVHLNLYEHRKNSLKELFDIADSIHCVSRDLKETIAPYCSYAQKIFINYSAVPVDYFKRENPYKNKEQLTILSVGRLNYIKGYLTGLLAIKELKKDAQNFKWIIVGEGKQRKELSFYIYALGLQNDVFLAGVKMGDEVKQAYRDADIFLLPSVSEGIATVALEAMATGLPVVSTRCGGMPEVITDNVDGLLADVFDYKMLAVHLLKLMNDFELRKRLGNAARQRVVNNFNLKLQVDIFEEEYKKILLPQTHETEK